MASMDSTTGKIVWAKHAEVQAASIKSLGSYEVQDGETLPLAVKEMGTSDVYPSFMRHSPNGRFIAVVSPGLPSCVCGVAALRLMWTSSVALPLF